ncbi:MAG: hypothetical protein JNL90_18815 [Planctomycetes bacterium]|nr:hypothetical protein [Planctomycetota bacterium]
MAGSSPADPAREPPPGSDAERAADLRTLKILLGWLGGCAMVAALYLTFAIWLDWI